MTSRVSDTAIDRSRVIEQAVARLDPLDRATLERIADMENGLWYLKRKIVDTADDDAMHDHTRPLKYAAHFGSNGGKVTFLREGSPPTPDLKVELDGVAFCLEVTKIRMGSCGHNEREECACRDVVSKMADLVTAKRRQLPQSGIGFVAIDNFDLRKERGFRHESVTDGFEELARRVTASPSAWSRPSGVIFSAASVIANRPTDIPNFLWINDEAESPPPNRLVQWLLDSLPNTTIVKPQSDPGHRPEAIVKYSF